jgi:outer membrane biosynthesis protein TonB
VSPNPDFGKVALAALNKWRFEPAKLDNQPVAVLIRVEFQFRFDGSEQESVRGPC